MGVRLLELLDRVYQQIKGEELILEPGAKGKDADVGSLLDEIGALIAEAKVEYATSTVIDPDAFYVLVIAPMNQSVVGPFAGREQAERHKIDAGYGRQVMTGYQLAQNFEAHGAIEIVKPDRTARS
jgi:hypothetical protein